MRLWEICSQIAALENAAEDGMYIHPETGELMTFDAAMDALQMERREKLENIALMAENAAVEAKALGEKIKALTERKRTAEGKASRCKGYLMAALVKEDGTTEKFATENVAVSVVWNSEHVVCDEDILPNEYKVVNTSTAPDKVRLKELIKSGEIIPGAYLERSRRVVIK